MSCARNGLSVERLRVVLGASLIALSAIASTSSAQPTSNPAEPVLRPIVEAENALRQNEPQLAESLYRTALQEGWLLLGTLAVADDDMEAAKSSYESALVSAADSYRAKLSLATLAIKTGNPGEAITPLRLIVSMNTMDHQARQLLAQALATNGQVNESIQEMRELRILFPNDLEINYQLATLLLRHERVDEVEPLFTDLAANRPMPQTYVLIGRTYRDFDIYPQAREALNRALEMDPQVRRANFYLGTVEFFEHGQSRINEAMAYLQAELELEPEDSMSNLYLGLALVEERREEEAIPPLEIASRHPRTQTLALEFLGRAYLRLGRIDEAVTYLRQALELAELLPDSGPNKLLVDHRLRQVSMIHYQLGMALRRSGDAEAAAPHFEAAEEFKARQTEDSRDRLETFMQIEPGKETQQSLTLPLETPELDGLSEQARRQLQEELEKHLAQVYLNLGVLQVQSQHLERAGDLFAEAAKLAPESHQVQYSLGVTRFNSGQFALATEPLARSLDSDPNNAELRRMLALAWFNTDHYEEAVALLRDDSEREGSRSLQYAYGLALVRSGKTEEAQEVFTELLTKYPDWGELSVVLGQAMAQGDDYPKAIEALEKAIEVQPDVAEAHLNLGEIYLRQGELESAERELRAELENYPHDLRAQNLLAMVLDLAGKQTEALEILSGVLEETPHSAKARYLMGKILLAQGHAEQAQIQLESATQLAPEDPEAWYQLGTALQRQGQRQEAAIAFKTYQELKREQRSGDSQ